MDGWRTPALALAVLVTVACQTVPITGRSQFLVLPEAEELKMGLTSYEEVLKKSRVSTDPALDAQLVRVGTRIAEATGKTDYKWEFKLLEDP